MHDVGSGLAAVEIDGHRADVFLNRPEKRNAMTAAVMRDLQAALEEADETDDVRAITVLGRGNVFCAGMDLELMRDRPRGARAHPRRLPGTAGDARIDDDSDRQWNWVVGDVAAEIDDCTDSGDYRLEGFGDVGSTG